MRETPPLTSDQVRRLFILRPATGELWWREAGGCGVKAGDPLGHSRPDGYLGCVVGGHHYLLHRLVWLHFYGEWPKDTVDHINGDRSDNSVFNLRDISKRANSQNIRRAKRRLHDLPLGVSRHGERFRARIDEISLGVFDTPEEASAAHIAAKRLRHEGCTI